MASARATNGASAKAFEGSEGRKETLFNKQFTGPVEIFSFHGYKEPRKALDADAIFPHVCEQARQEVICPNS